MRTILASVSPRRHELLSMIGIAHEVRPAGIDETYRPGELPAEHAERLAREKAVAIADIEPDAVVLSADTIVVIDGDMLGKPADEGQAAAMLARLAGRTHTVVSGVAVARGARVLSGVEEVAVTFRTLGPDEITAYIATGEPMDKAGAYGIQGFGATIVERIEGDYFAVMGLPLCRMIALLVALGLTYDFRSLRDGGAR